MLTVAAGCSQASPVAPSAGQPQPSTSWTIAGTVWVHTATGVAPANGGQLFGWVERPGFGQTQGPVPIGTDGRYQFTVPTTTTYVSLFGGPGHQPCAVDLAPSGDTTVDVHRVTDESQLGANLPAALLAHTPVLSGVVYENTPAGHQPLAGAWVTLDGLGGMGVLIADTLTDEDGRYTLCGVPQRQQTTLVPSKAGFDIRYIGFTDIVGRSTLDIEMRRTGGPVTGSVRLSSSAAGRSSSTPSRGRP